MNSNSQPTLVYDLRGFLLMILLGVLGVSFIIIGYLYNTVGLVLWGLVLSVGLILAIIPLTARLTAYKVLVNHAERMEFEKRLKEKLEKIQTQEDVESKETQK